MGDIEVKAGGEEMKIEDIIHKLRNPWGLDEYQLKALRLAAADALEMWMEAHLSLAEFAISKGLDITTYQPSGFPER